MLKAKHTIPLKLIWGVLLLTTGLLLGAWVMKQQFPDSATRTAARASAVLPIAWGGLLVVTNLFAYIGYAIIYLTKREALTHSAMLMSRKHFWFDVFDLAKVYKKLLPKTEEQYAKLVKRELRFLETTFGYVFSYLKVRRENGSNGTYYIYQYKHPVLRRQILLVNQDFNVFPFAFICKNTNDVFQAFPDRDSWISIIELANVQHKDPGYFYKLLASVMEEPNLQYLYAYAIVLQEQAAIVQGSGWPSVSGNELYLQDMHSNIPTWKNLFHFLVTQYGYAITDDPSVRLPFAVDYFNSNLAYTSGDGTVRVIIAEIEDEENIYQVDIEYTKTSRQKQISGVGTVRDQFSHIREALVKELSL